MLKNQKSIMIGVISLTVAVMIAITFGSILKRQDWYLITGISLFPTLIGIACGVVAAKEKKKNEESKEEEWLTFWLGYVAMVALVIDFIIILEGGIATLLKADWIAYVVVGAIAAIIATIVAFVWTNTIMSRK